jgi:hypothetical protein
MAREESVQCAFPREDNMLRRGSSFTLGGKYVTPTVLLAAALFAMSIQAGFISAAAI